MVSLGPSVIKVSFSLLLSPRISVHFFFFFLYLFAVSCRRRDALFRCENRLDCTLITASGMDRRNRENGAQGEDARQWHTIFSGFFSLSLSFLYTFLFFFRVFFTLVVLRKASCLCERSNNLDAGESRSERTSTKKEEPKGEGSKQEKGGGVSLER